MGKPIYLANLLVRTKESSKKIRNSHGQVAIVDTSEYREAKEIVILGDNIDAINNYKHTVDRVAKTLKIKNRDAIKIIKITKIISQHEEANE